MSAERNGEQTGQSDSDGRERLGARLKSLGIPAPVIRAILNVPREQFTSHSPMEWAWLDESLPIGEGQTISQPSLVARMIDYMSLGPGGTVLDVGTGSGYQAAVLSYLAGRVISVERVATLRMAADERLKSLGLHGIEVRQATGHLGWPDDAPYDGIIVAAASPHVPEILVGQLKVGARLIIPIGSHDYQQIAVVERTETGTHTQWHEHVRFVPLIGQGAWDS